MQEIIAIYNQITEWIFADIEITKLVIVAIVLTGLVIYGTRNKEEN